MPKPYVEHPITHLPVPATPLPLGLGLTRTKKHHTHHTYTAGQHPPIASETEAALLSSLASRRRSSAHIIVPALHSGLQSPVSRTRSMRNKVVDDPGKFMEKLKNVRLGLNYYGDEDRVTLHRHALYEPPTSSGNAVVTKIVAREFSLEKWCMELANGTATVLMSNYALAAVPPPLMKMLHLTTLNLSFNKLTNLPTEIGYLVHLVELDVSSNLLTSLPPEIGMSCGSEMKNFVTGGIVTLEKLDISNNQLVEIPESFNRLVSLRELELNSNCLTLLPSGFSRWKLLTKFCPNENALELITHDLCNMSLLVELNLSKNKLTELPPALGKLKNLVRLDCSFNKLCQLPTTVVEMNKLEVLLLIDNQLALLPINMGEMTNLRELNLYRNLLEDLPVSMKHLKKVEFVDLDYNPLNDIPALIRDEGWESICRFLSSDIMTRRRIKLRDHAQTVGEGVLGKDVPKLVELRIKLEEEERRKKKLRKGRKFNFKKFEQDKAKEILSVQVRKPKVDEGTWLLFAGEGDLKMARKVRQTEMNKTLFDDVASEIRLEGSDSSAASDCSSCSSSSEEEEKEEGSQPTPEKADAGGQERRRTSGGRKSTTRIGGRAQGGRGGGRGKQPPLVKHITPRARGRVLKDNKFNVADYGKEGLNEQTGH